MLTEILIILFSAIFFVWHRFNFSYWKRHNVKYIEPSPLIGNVTLKLSFFELLQKLYQAEGLENEKAIGIYVAHRPALLIKDLDLIKRIMIKNFNNFADHVVQPDAAHDRLTAENLFFTSAAKWKELRPRMSPIFSSGKIKLMYTLMGEVS